MLIGNEYKSIRPVKESIVVNLGGIMEEITGEKLKATFHRVLDIGKERYSSPFFFEPRYETPIPLNLFENDENKI